jgi:hypothetical protein
MVELSSGQLVALVIYALLHGVCLVVGLILLSRVEWKQFTSDSRGYRNKPVLAKVQNVLPGVLLLFGPIIAIVGYVVFMTIHYFAPESQKVWYQAK